MAIVDSGTSRFPFLATVRYVLATVVTVLTVVVVVMVITVALRPEDIRLSILQGYIQADTLWQAKEIKTDPETGYYSRSRSRYPFDIGDDPVTYHIYYEPATYVNLVVSLTAQNPSGRAGITCQNITVRVLDMPGGGGGGAPYNFTGMVDLQTFPLTDRFTVARQSSRTVKTRVTLNDTRALSYIATNYGGESSFKAMVQVNATVASTSMTWRHNTTSHYCWPVTIGSYEPDVANGDVACKPSQEMGYTVPSVPPA